MMGRLLGIILDKIHDETTERLYLQCRSSVVERETKIIFKCHEFLHVREYFEKEDWWRVRTDLLADLRNPTGIIQAVVRRQEGEQ
jgi:hypothetical protein